MNATSVSATRRYDIDWLRVLLILTVLVFHSLRFFDLEGWSVKNPTNYQWVQILVIFVSRWMMPAIMLISGTATFYALGKRGARPFVGDRSLRLLVPLLIGIFTHIPLQGYLEQVSQHAYTGTFWQYYTEGVLGPQGLGRQINWFGGHLWYLEALFLFSLVCLPLFAWLRHGAGQRALAWLGDRLASPGALYLPVLLIVLLSAGLDPDHGGLLTGQEFGGWNLPSYLVFFLSGFVFAASLAMQARIRQIRRTSLGIGVMSFAIGGGSLFALTGGDVAFGSPIYWLWSVISSLCCWACVLAILGFGMQRLNLRTPVLDYANEAVLPFYVLHQTVLLVIGFYVMNWSIPDLAKWAIALTGTLLICVALYEFLVRRINPLRVLFGMRPVYKEKVAQKPAVQVS